MRESPRLRRLRTDLKALEKLREESSIVDFAVNKTRLDAPPESYTITFRGKGLWRADMSSDVLIREEHVVRVCLGASYPRMMPDLSWKTPVFHPNISGSGVVCLGGYGTHWVPSLNLDELCVMLWDMIRYQNFDVESPYNREAAWWAKSQQDLRLPLDDRPLRDRLAGVAPAAKEAMKPPITAEPIEKASIPDVSFINGEQVVEAELVEERSDILFIE
jgi:ubiquitin-protein ligase